MTLPVQGSTYTFYRSLVDVTNPDNWLVNPTIEAGDFTVSTDGNTFTNMDNLPAVEPAGSALVKFVLSVAEATGEKANIIGIDQAGNAWQDIGFSIDLPTASTETINDIQEGDHVENSTSLVINKKGTSTAVLQKDITGSLLSPSVTVTTTEP